ncbi:TPA: type 1 fimbrial protein [Klebsiella oxytoca]|nr:type 1 fimbrial protein [Klebsiella oxytoca]
MNIQKHCLFIVLMTGLIYAPVHAASSDIDFKGTLVAEPCVVATGNDGDNVVVDFGTIPGKTFYSAYGHRTWLQPFHILLKECDLTLGKEVKITFTGTADAEQPELLAMSSSNGVSHLAIGIQSDTGKEIPVSQQMDSYILTTGSTQLNFKAYVQASDEGVANKSVGTGTFDAVSTFELEYP